MSAQPVMQPSRRQGPPADFRLGRLCTTVGAFRAMARIAILPIHLIARHAAGDWGDLDEHDWQANEQALKEGARLLSVYHVEEIKFYVITEADRSLTTVLLASEY